jgi:hypothetical protein
MDPGNAWETLETLRDRRAKVYGGVEVERQVFPLELYIRSASLGAGEDSSHVQSSRQPHVSRHRSFILCPETCLACIFLQSGRLRLS